jgi:hypothetical protein
MCSKTLSFDSLSKTEFGRLVRRWRASTAARWPQDTIVLTEEAVAQADNLLGGWNMERLQRMMQRLRLSPKQQEFIIRRPDQLGLT